MATSLVNVVGGALAAELGALAERVRAGVVRITNGRGAGSGTIWHEDGPIVTNYHVVPGERAKVTLADGREFPGTVVSNLPERDLAVIRVPAQGLPALPVGDSGALRVGEIVVAVGHPLGVPGAVTFGIYSGTGPIEGAERNGRHFREASWPTSSCDPATRVGRWSMRAARSSASTRWSWGRARRWPCRARRSCG